ncbi:MAG: PilZ domain-containing protein [Candidatus Sedimenticola sp. (ex Thyasira tokunagai)]
MVYDRRIYYRLNDDLPAKVFNQAGEAMDAHIVELSVGGLKFEADDALVDHIQLLDQFGKTVFQEKIRTEFSLQQGNMEVSVTLHCRQVYKRRLSQHLYHIGVLILSYEERADEQLKSYISNGIGTIAAFG